MLMFSRENLTAVRSGNVSAQMLEGIASLLTTPLRKEVEGLVRELDKTNPGILVVYKAIASNPGVATVVDQKNAELERAADQAPTSGWEYAAWAAAGAALAAAGFMLIRKGKQKGWFKPLGRALRRLRAGTQRGVARAEEAVAGRLRITPTELPEQPAIRKGISDAFAADVIAVGQAQARKRLAKMGEEMAGRGYQVMDSAGQLRRVKGLKLEKEKIVVVLESEAVQVESAVATIAKKAKSTVALEDAVFHEPLTVAQGMRGRTGTRLAEGAQRARKGAEETVAKVEDEAVASGRVVDILGSRTRIRWKGPVVAAGAGALAAAGAKLAAELAEGEARGRVVGRDTTRAIWLTEEEQRLQGMELKAYLEDLLAKAKKGVASGNREMNWGLVRDCVEWLLANVDFTKLDEGALKKFEKACIARTSLMYVAALMNYVTVAEDRKFLLPDEERMAKGKYGSMQKMNEVEAKLAGRVEEALGQQQ
ncbi:hypothetical protein HY992_06395 [Candidatus Micrarchaeota archaeon]|nr:hypothetical protein [Candidatus Micrarchaeota archaeon]